LAISSPSGVYGVFELGFVLIRSSSEASSPSCISRSWLRRHSCAHFCASSTAQCIRPRPLSWPLAGRIFSTASMSQAIKCQELPKPVRSCAQAYGATTPQTLERYWSCSDDWLRKKYAYMALAYWGGDRKAVMVGRWRARV
jgi:hypothetical protein